MGTGSHFGAVGGVSLQWRGSASLYAKLGFHMVDVHSYVYMHTYTHVHTMSRMWIRDQDHCRKHVMAEHEPRWGMFRAWSSNDCASQGPPRAPPASASPLPLQLQTSVM